MKIVNIIVTGELNCELNLYSLVVDCELNGTNARANYDPRSFNGCIYRIMGATILIFSNGKLTCMGVDSFDKAFEAINQCILNLKNIGYEPKLRNVKIRNVVCSHDFKQTVDYAQVHQELNCKCAHTPETFCGMRIFMHNFTVILFRNGKIILTGAVDTSVYDNMLNVLKNIINKKT